MSRTVQAVYENAPFVRWSRFRISDEGDVSDSEATCGRFAAVLVLDFLAAPFGFDLGKLSHWNGKTI
jgi:hypothetical protein